jgi:hypothetical protein
MDTRTARVNHHRGAKDQLCVPQMFSFGHVRQLDELSEAMLTRAWSLGAGPSAEPMTIDVDSTICPVHGDHK